MSDLETQTAPDDLRSSLEAAFVEAETPVVEAPVKTRDESGKFAKATEKEITDVAPKVTPPVAEKAPVDEQKPPEPVKRPPSSWKKETQAEWEKLPPHVQDDVLRRESDFHKGIEGYKQAAQRAQSFDQAIQPYQQNLQKLGVTPEVAVGALFKADDMLRNGSPQEKVAYFSQLAREYGIPIEQLQALPPVDPAYQQVLNELQSLKQKQASEMQTRQQAEQEQLNSQISSFAEGKEHFNAVRDDMAALLQAGRAPDLETAYDMAIWARPDLRSGLLEQQTRAAEEKARAAMQGRKAQSAAVSVRGSSPVTGSTNSASDVRSAIEAAFNT